MATTYEYRDYRDMTIDDLASELASVKDALVNAIRDAESYQLLAKLAIEKNAALTRENANLKQRAITLAEQVRDLIGVDRSELGEAA